MNKFQQLGLEDHLLQAIKDLGFETPSEVQQKAIPTLLSDENDLCLTCLYELSTISICSISISFFNK